MKKLKPTIYLQVSQYWQVCMDNVNLWSLDIQIKKMFISVL